MVNGHVGLKYIYFRLCHKSDLIHSRSKRSVGIWIGLGLTCWVVAWVIAEAIPVFSDLNGLIVSQVLSPVHSETYANRDIERALRQLVQLWAQWCLLASSELWAVVRQPS